MKNRLFPYLFMFSALIALYLFVSSGKMADSYENRIKKLGGKVEKLQDSVQTTTLRALEMQYFSLENNDDALAYYDHLSIKNPSRYIADKLLETNESKGNNPLILMKVWRMILRLIKLKY